MTTPKVITLATLKSGSGKSTLAACLAAHWRLRGDPVALVDAALQSSTAHWHDVADSPLAGSAVKLTPGQDVGELVHGLARRHHPVIIDTAEFRSRTTTDALAMADLALLPLTPSPVDLKVGLETRRFVEELNRTEARAGRPIVVRFVLTKTTADGEIVRVIRAEMQRAGLTVLTATLASRPDYRHAAGSGRTPSVADPDSVAAREIGALAGEIENCV
jgi:chromosome partitioning protein